MLVEHFVQGGACPNFFYHKEKSDRCNVHGDDFTSVGPRNSLDWFEASVAEKYEVNVRPRLGPGRTDAKEGNAKNRVARWCDNGSAWYCTRPIRSRPRISLTSAGSRGPSQLLRPRLELGT